MSRSVFLCHSSRDKEFVRRLASRLREFGVKVWLDEAEMKVGDSLQEKIGVAIEECEYFIVVLSGASVGSEWVQRELRIAVQRELSERKVVVLPLLLEQVRVPPFLRDKVYADFAPPGEFNESTRKLLTALGVTDQHLSQGELQSFEFHTLHHYVEILDTSGKKAIWRKESVVTPTISGIEFWRDEEFHGTGNLRFVQTIPGQIDRVETEGGTLSVVTRFSPALVKGKKMIKVLEVEVIDSFLSEREDISWVPLGDFEELGFHIKLPRGRPCKGYPEAYFKLATQQHPFGPVTVSAEGTDIDVVIRRPIQGARYVVVWCW